MPKSYLFFLEEKDEKWKLCRKRDDLAGVNFESVGGTKTSRRGKHLLNWELLPRRGQKANTRVGGGCEPTPGVDSFKTLACIQKEDEWNPEDNVSCWNMII